MHSEALKTKAQTFGARCTLCGIERRVIERDGWKFRMCSVCDFPSWVKRRAS